ncbi:MAG: hypothetical protein SGPRY_011504, partial [Prymnesium sp.]
MLGTQHCSAFPSAPSYGFGTAERSREKGGKVFISKDMVSDMFGMNSPGPVYHPKTVDGRFYTAPSHSFGSSHRYSTSQQKAFNAQTPGPGQYTLPGSVNKQADSLKHSYSTWKFGTSTRRDQAKIFAGNAHAKTEGEFIGLGTSERFFYENNSSLERKAGPGPGAYTLGPAHGRQVTSDRPSYRITSFSRADRDRTAATVYLGPKQQSAFWGRNSPGPAVYTLTQAVGPQNSSQRPNGPKYAGWAIRTMSDGMTALRQQDT